MCLADTYNNSTLQEEVEGSPLAPALGCSEVKIDEAKAIMLKNVGVNLDEEETLVDMEEAKHIADREIREDEAEEEEDDEDERDTTMIVR